MAETLGNLAVGFGVALSPPVLFYAFVGCVVGTLVDVGEGRRAAREAAARIDRRTDSSPASGECS